MNALKNQFAELLAVTLVQESEAGEDSLAGLALLASEILAVSSDPQNTEQASADAALARRRMGALIADAEQDLAEPGAGVETVSGSGVMARASTALVDYLGGVLRFRGNVDDYYNPSNSDLGWVLARRRGIPITLALIYITVGRALGYELRGIGFPGHFLVGVYASRADTQPGQIIDPFRARLTSREECMRAIEQQQAPQAAGATQQTQIVESLFIAATPAAVLLRLLENLKQIHLRDHAIGPALAALELQLLVAPESFELRSQQEVLVSQAFGRKPGSGGKPELH